MSRETLNLQKGGGVTCETSQCQSFLWGWKAGNEIKFDGEYEFNLPCLSFMLFSLSLFCDMIQGMLLINAMHCLVLLNVFCTCHWHVLCLFVIYYEVRYLRKICHGSIYLWKTCPLAETKKESISLSFNVKLNFTIKNIFKFHFKNHANMLIIGFQNMTTMV